MVPYFFILFSTIILFSGKHFPVPCIIYQESIIYRSLYGFLSYADAAGKLASGEIDGLFCTAGIRTAVIEELAKECDLRLLSIDDTCLEELLATTREYRRYIIPANTYSGQNKDVTTIGVKAVLLASDDLSKETVEKLTETLFSHAQDLAYATSLDAAFDETDASSGVTIPFHPGAAAYYAKQGISVNTK